MSAEPGTGLRFAEVRTNAERVDAAALLAAVWGVPPSESPVPSDLMVALGHAGGCVLGAWTPDGTLVGVTVGLAGAPNSDVVYSYIAGVARGFAGGGIGRQLKLAQRDWALERGASRLIWTYDPLIRRNGHFNLNRLGGRVTGFVPDYYPPMADAVNAGDLPDRFVVEWTLAEPVGGRPLPSGVDTAPVVLGPVEASEPGLALDAIGGADPVLRVWVPSDIEGLRAGDPELGRRWRLASREAFTALFASGFEAVGLDVDGHYVFVREV